MYIVLKLNMHHPTVLDTKVSPKGKTVYLQCASASRSAWKWKKLVAHRSFWQICWIERGKCMQSRTPMEIHQTSTTIYIIWRRFVLGRMFSTYLCIDRSRPQSQRLIHKTRNFLRSLRNLSFTHSHRHIPCIPHMRVIYSPLLAV